MSLQYDSLHDALLALQRDVDAYHSTVERFIVSATECFAAQDRRESELRDDLCALANRVEASMRGAS